MSSVIVMALEGVLVGKDDDVELTLQGPTAIAPLLYGSFARTTRLVLATKLDRRLVDHWCRQFGFHQHSFIEQLDDRTCTRVRAAGSPIDLYIDHNADRLAQAARIGVTTMLISQPAYARERPISGAGQRTKPWAQVVAESRAQRDGRPSVTADD